jgi:hypothetical protein
MTIKVERLGAAEHHDKCEKCSSGERMILEKSSF